ncbi:hypothetical protein [Streptomyces sp. NRRL S-1022]|uniref:hypothetical protein n=1 Tax=Streptomyces sp. NRRL S-1022 TaxID=1463880 RepID=UPI0004C0AE6E|nr:hypothetical protein [Streptomyces sp. NRRL S-1022]
MISRNRSTSCCFRSVSGIGSPPASPARVPPAQDLARYRPDGSALTEPSRPFALAAPDRGGHARGAALKAVTGLADPGHIALGGHLANWPPWLRPGIDARLGLRRTVFLTPVTVIPEALGADAALTAGREQILANPTTAPRSR